MENFFFPRLAELKINERRPAFVFRPHQKVMIILEFFRSLFSIRFDGRKSLNPPSAFGDENIYDNPNKIK